MTQVITQVNDTFIEEFEISPDKLHPEANLFSELGLDSLDAIDMIVYLEEKLKIKLKGEGFKTVRTLADVYKIVAEVSKTAEFAQEQKT